MKKNLIIIASLPILFFGFSDPKNILAIEKIKDVFKSTREIQSLSYEFIRSERIDGKMVESHSKVKMQRKPYKVYVKESFPNSGMEVLYPTADSKALVNPNGFPWMNLTLDPKGDLMRKNQHHTVMEGGYDYMISVMEYVFYKYRSNISELIRNDGYTIWNGRSCDIVTLSNPNFKYINYTVKKGETVSSIATKYRLNEYMIFQNNDNLGFIRDVMEGDLIKLPSDYSASITLFIDQEKQIPLVIKVHDEKGLFEQYEFKNVTLNPKIEPEEFTEAYAAYNF